MEQNDENDKISEKRIKVAFIGDMGVGKTLLYMRVNNLLNNKDDYKSPNDFISQKEYLINNTTKNGCLINEKELKIENDKNIYKLELWDLSNTFNTFRFNRFPITRKFYFVSDAQIIILCCEPKVPKTFETIKILYNISKVRADPNAIFVLCLTKCDLNYSEEELIEIKNYAKDNELELIFSSSFKDEFGLEYNLFKNFIIKYNNKNTNIK